MSSTMTRPRYYAEKLPATKPERMSRDEPPCCAPVTTSFTCRDSGEVKTFTSSGMMAPASVPQEMMTESFHHCVESPPSSGMISRELRNVSAMETNDVIHTSEVSGASKF